MCVCLSTQIYNTDARTHTHPGSCGCSSGEADCGCGFGCKPDPSHPARVPVRAPDHILTYGPASRGQQHRLWWDGRECSARWPCFVLNPPQFSVAPPRARLPAVRAAFLGVGLVYSLQRKAVNLELHRDPKRAIGPTRTFRKRIARLGDCGGIFHLWTANV